MLSGGALFDIVASFECEAAARAGVSFSVRTGMGNCSSKVCCGLGKEFSGDGETALTTARFFFGLELPFSPSNPLVSESV